MKLINLLSVQNEKPQAKKKKELTFNEIRLLKKDKKLIMVLKAKYFQ